MLRCHLISCISPIRHYHGCTSYYVNPLITTFVLFLFEVLIIFSFWPKLEKETKGSPLFSEDASSFLSADTGTWNTLSQGAYCIMYKLSYGLIAQVIFLYLSVCQSKYFKKGFQTDILIILHFFFH